MESKNYRVIVVKHYNETEHKPNRVRLSHEVHNAKDKVLWVSYSNFNNAYETAIEYLKKTGWNVKGHAFLKGKSIIFCDNWGEDYKVL